MKHPTQISEETVSRFINESMKTKTMMEAKKKAKKSKAKKSKIRDYDYSDEEGAGKRERQEMQGDHQEHEGDGINELKPVSDPTSFAARATRSRERKVAGLHKRGGEAESAANRYVQTTGGRTGAQKMKVPDEHDRFMAGVGSDTQAQNVAAGSPEGVSPRRTSPGKEVRLLRNQTARSIRNLRADTSRSMGAEGPGTGVKDAGFLPMSPRQRAARARKAVRPLGRFKRWMRVRKATKAFKAGGPRESRRLEGELQNEAGVRDLARKAAEKVKGSRPYRKLRVAFRRGGALHQSAKQEADAQMYGDLPNYP